MIYKIYTFRYETIKFLYGLGKGHQQFIVSFLVRYDPSHSIGRERKKTYVEIQQIFKPTKLQQFYQVFNNSHY